MPSGRRLDVAVPVLATLGYVINRSVRTLSLNGEPTFVGPAEDPDRYELQERRAAGGEGEVWRASERSGGELFSYAVKVINVGGDAADRHLEELRLQAALATHLEHPALVKVKEVFVGPPPHPAGQGGAQPGRRLYLVMKWIEGRSLQEALERRELQGLDVLTPLEPIAEAIDYLHSGRDTNGNPVIHRDIKPANVLLARDGRVYLVDFGLVRLRSTDNTSRIFGTAPFMAPESLARGEYTPATDRYTLGATVYYALTGEAPVPGDTDGMTQRLTSALGAGRDREVRGVLTMLAARPEARPPSAAGWLRALRSAPMETTVGGDPSGVPPTTGPTSAGAAGLPPTTGPTGYPLPPGSGPTLGGAAAAGAAPQLPPTASSYLGAPPKPAKSNSGKVLLIILGVVMLLLVACCWSFWEALPKHGDDNGGYGAPSPSHSFDKSKPPPEVTKLKPVLVSVSDITSVMGVASNLVDASSDDAFMAGGLANLELCSGEVVPGYAIGGSDSNNYYVGTNNGYPDVGSSVAGFYSDEAETYFKRLKAAAERCGWNEMQSAKLGEQTLGMYVEESDYGKTALVFVRTGQVIMQVGVNCNDCGSYQSWALGLAAKMAKRMPKGKA